MEKRRLGRTEQRSTVVALGGAALMRGTLDEAKRLVDLVLSHGVNHIDVAPSYGDAEVLLGPAIESHRKEFFLACKTSRRSRDGAWDNLQRSLERLHTDHFDLYQLHGVSEMPDLDRVLGPGGALEAILEARRQGLVRFIGITGHCPAVQVAALERFDFDTVLFPLNRVLAAHGQEYSDYGALLKLTKERDIGAMAIKAVAKQPWSSEEHAYQTWYEPYDTQDEIDACLWFTLSHDIATTPMASDIRLVPMILDAAERFQPLNQAELGAARQAARAARPIFPRA